jgi:hypothetical protein
MLDQLDPLATATCRRAATVHSVVALSYIWIAPAHAAPQDCEDEEPADAEAILPPASAETRQEIAMLRNVIVALAKAGRPIHIDSILLERHAMQSRKQGCVFVRECTGVG